MKPTDKEYIEALAYQEYPKLDTSNIEQVVARINKRNGVIEGYQLALEHTNHVELLEAAKNVIIWASEFGMNEDVYFSLERAIQKSEANKLNK